MTISDKETRTAAYLAERVSREESSRELGIEILADVERQRDALKRDVEWGTRDFEISATAPR